MSDIYSLSSRLYKWLFVEPEPAIRQSNVQILRIPADGSQPHVISVNSIDVTAEGNIDAFLGHIPDFRPFWGKSEGYQWRDVCQIEVNDQSNSELNGIYWGWKSFAMDFMPVSEHTGFCGNAFIAKTPNPEYDETGITVYQDIPQAFSSSPLLRRALERLHDL